MRLMPKKLLMSLTLTPLTDRLLLNIFGVRTVGQPTMDMGEDSNPFGDDDFTGDSKKESIEHLILIFKFCMVIGLYAYSTYSKAFREKHQNFNDDDEGLSKVIDSMITKIA